MALQPLHPLSHLFRTHVQGDDAAEELGSHAVTNGSDDVYISVPDSNPMPADLHTIKGLSYTQAFGIFKVLPLVYATLFLLTRCRGVLNTFFLVRKAQYTDLMDVLGLTTLGFLCRVMWRHFVSVCLSLSRTAHLNLCCRGLGRSSKTW
jgi:hypothetical protein